MSCLTRVYGVLDSDGSYRFLAEESRAALMDETGRAESFLGQLDGFGVPYRRKLAQAILQRPNADGAVIERMTDIYEIDLDGALPCDITDVIDIAGGRSFPRVRSCDGDDVREVVSACDLVRFSPEGVASMAPFDAGNGVVWVLSCEKTDDEHQHAEFLCESGFAIDIGDYDLFTSPDLSQAYQVANVATLLSDGGGLRGSVCPASILDEVSVGEKTLDIVALGVRAKLGFDPQHKITKDVPDKVLADALVEAAESGHIDPACKSLCLSLDAMKHAVSGTDVKELLDAAAAHEVLTDAGLEEMWPGANEVAGRRIPHAVLERVDGQWMLDRGIAFVESGSQDDLGSEGYVDLVYDGQELELFVEHYITNPRTLAIKAKSSDTGDTYASLTVNLGERLPWCEGYVDEHGLPGISQALVSAGIARDTGIRATPLGSPSLKGTYPRMVFDEDVLYDIDKVGMDGYRELFEEAFEIEMQGPVRDIGQSFGEFE